jgi:probable HAF family extracellular repeat protein
LLGAALGLTLMGPSGQAAPPPLALAVLLVKENLETLPGDTASEAYGINASRQIVGYSTGPNGSRAFLWTPPGPMIALSAPEGVELYRASDINDAGQVVGTGGGLEAFYDAYVWTPPGDVVGLGNVGALDEQGVGINNLGWAVGYGEVPPYGPTIWIPPGPNLAFPETAGFVGGADDVNDAGQVVGNTQLWSPGTDRPLYWSQADGLRQLAGLDADSAGRARAINLGGAIVGESTTAGVPRAVMWTSFDDDPVDLGTLGGASATARGISNNGVVVGRSELAAPDVTHAFRRSPGQPMQDLGTLGGANSEAYDVNSAGHAVGAAETANGQLRAVAWWRYGSASSFKCDCRPSDPAPTWPKTVVAVLIPGSRALQVSRVDANTLTLGDGDGDDAPVAVAADGRRLAIRGDFDGDGVRDLLVAFNRKQVAAMTARAHAMWLIGALRDRSNGVFGRVDLALQ